VSEGAVCACYWTWEGLVAATGGAMVERGDWSSIHVGSHRKAYQARNDFLIFVADSDLLYEGDVQYAFNIS